MVAPSDITGQRFGRLVALAAAGSNGRRRLWRFRCDCGNETVRSIPYKDSPHTNCGCFKSGWLNKGRPPASKTHGMSRTRLYRIWKNMMMRCHNPKNHRYADYGGRGIFVCPPWQQSDAFLSWALDNDYSDELQLDRIDNDLGYGPENCRFVTPKENMSHMRTSRSFVFSGERLTVREAEARYGVAAGTITRRILELGMTPDAAVSTLHLRKGAKPKHGRYSKYA